MDNIDVAFMLTLVTGIIQHRRANRNTTGVVSRRWWVHPLNQAREREGAWNLLISRFREEFPEKHLQCMRMTRDHFDTILLYIQPKIELSDTHLRRAITPSIRLSVTLYFLATGDSINTCSLLYRLGESTVRGIIYSTCEAIWSSLAPLYMKTPSTEAEWKNVADGFATHWNLPNCIGALDGKHCTIQCPPNSGSEYFNYKKYFSVVLMAACDSLYKFIYVDVGTPGRWSDGGTFDHCNLRTAMVNSTLNIPMDSQLPGNSQLQVGH